MAIYYFCPDSDKPSGGVKQIYRHVDVLNRHGMSAYVLHKKPGFRCSWFENDTNICNLGEEGIHRFSCRALNKLGLLKKKPLLFPGRTVFNEKCCGGKRQKLTDKDIVVVPEFYGEWLSWGVKNLPLVIFNQNFFHTFFGYSFRKLYADGAYNSRDLRGVITVSSHDQQAMEYTFPSVEVYRVHNGIDQSIFCPQSLKKKQIAFMPRKCSNDALLVANILRCRGKIEEWELVSIENLPEEKVAQILRESLIFLNFVKQESFGLPAVEAALCGCTVIGNDGVGGREFFHQDHAYTVPYGDVVTFAKTVEEVIALYETDPSVLSCKTELFMKFAKNQYSLEQEEADVINIWKKILS